MLSRSVCRLAPVKNVNWSMLSMFPELKDGLNQLDTGRYTMASEKFSTVSKTMNQFASGSVEALSATLLAGSSQFLSGRQGSAKASLDAKSVPADVQDALAFVRELVILSSNKSISTESCNKFNSLINCPAVSDYIDLANSINSAYATPDLAFESLMAKIESLELPTSIPNSDGTVEKFLARDLAAFKAQAPAILAVALSESLVFAALRDTPTTAKAVMSAKAAMQVKTGSQDGEMGGEALAAAQNCLKRALKVVQKCQGVSGIINTPAETKLSVVNAWALSLLAKVVAVRSADPIVSEGLSRSALSNWASAKTMVGGDYITNKNPLNLSKHAQMLSTHADILGFWEKREEEMENYVTSAEKVKGDIIKIDGVFFEPSPALLFEH